MIVGIDARLQFGSGQDAFGFQYRTFAMHPARFNRIEPGTFRRQPVGHHTDADAVAFHPLIVRAEPVTHGGACMPGGVIPDQEQGALALGRQLITTPTEELDGQVTHRLSGSEPQQELA